MALEASFGMQLSASPAIALCGTPSPHSPHYPASSAVQAVSGVFAIVFAACFSPMVVDRPLCIAFLFAGVIYLLFFKIGSTVLQRTIYDPILGSHTNTGMRLFSYAKLQNLSFLTLKLPK